MKQQIQYNDVSERQKSYVVAKRKTLAVLIFNLFILRTHYAYNYYFQLNYIQQQLLSIFNINLIFLNNEDYKIV